MLIVRAHVLPHPHVVANTAAYEGCVSWVRLDAAVPTTAALPALGDAEFARIRADVLARLA